MQHSAWCWSWCNQILCVHVFYRLIHCTWVYPLDLFAPFFGYYFFNVMLCVLQMLHVYWAVLILRMLCKFLFSTVGLQMFLRSYIHPCEICGSWYFYELQINRLCLILVLQLEGDDRSDEEEDDGDSSTERNHKQSHINGSGTRGRANGHWHVQTDTEKMDGRHVDVFYLQCSWCLKKKCFLKDDM